MKTFYKTITTLFLLILLVIIFKPFKKHNPLLTVRIIGNITNITDSTYAVKFYKIIHGSKMATFDTISVKYKRKPGLFLKKGEELYLICGRFLANDTSAFNKVLKNFKKDHYFYRTNKIILPLRRW